jgi:hypothetical protein
MQRNVMTAVRRAAVSRLCAAGLLVLAALPCTAPFSTLDLAAPASSAPVHEGALGKTKLPSEWSPVIVDSASSAPAGRTNAGHRVSPATAPRPFDGRPGNRPILRL